MRSASFAGSAVASARGTFGAGGGAAAVRSAHTRGGAHLLCTSAHQSLAPSVHACRYIVTARGLACMLEKFKNYEFGRCPRVFCEGQACVPCGTSDVPGQSTVKIFCPKCEDIYYPRSEYQCSIDGAYFGTTFPHLLLMTYPMYR